MEDEKKVRTSMTLKPINKRWLENKAYEESTPGNSVSSSEIADRLIDAAREAEAAESKSTTSKQKKSAQALELATA